MYRLRLKFGRGEKLKYISHLDLMRLWERAMRRARLQPLYSEGFSPHPRISFASPLATGVISRAEIMDIYLKKMVAAEEFLQRLKSQLPAGIELLEAAHIKVDEPSLQSSLRYAEYEVTVENDAPESDVENMITRLMELESLPWHHARDTGERYYDLRMLIDSIWIVDYNAETCRIGMKLRSDSSGTGRPEQVAKALGFEERPLSIERTQLVFN